MTDRHGSTMLDPPLKVKKRTKVYSQFSNVSVEESHVYCREIQNVSEMKLCLTGILLIPTDLLYLTALTAFTLGLPLGTCT